MKRLKNIPIELRVFKKIENFLIRMGGKEYISGAGTLLIMKTAYELNVSCSVIIWQIFKKLYSRIEFRSIFAKGRYHSYPFFLRSHRQIYFVTKWLLLAVKANKERISVSAKFANELTKLLSSEENSIAKTNRNENVQAAILSRSKVHYRW